MTTYSTSFLLLLASLVGIGPLSTDMYLPAFPEMTEFFHTTPSYIQLTLSSYLLGLAFGQLLCGPLSDIHGRKGPLLIGILLYSISSFICIITSSIPILIGARLLTGFSAATMLVIARSIAADRYHGNELTHFFSIMMVIQGIAPIIAPIAGGYILYFLPWQSIFLVLTILGLLLLFLVYRMLEETLPAEKRLPFEKEKIIATFTSLLKSKAFLPHCLLQFFLFSALFSYISGAPFMLQVQYHFSSQDFALVFGFIGVCMAVSGYITTLCVGKIDERKLLFIELCRAVIASLLFFFTALFHGPIWLLLILLILTLTTLPNIASTSFSLALRNTPYIGTASALLGFFNTICGSLVSPLVGLGNSPSITLGIVLFSCELLACLTFLFYLNKKTTCS